MHYLFRLYPVFAVIVFAFFLHGCFNKQEKSLKYDSQSQLLTTKIIENYTSHEYEDLRSKLAEPVTAAVAETWYPVAERITSLTTEAYSRIDSCFKLNNDETTLEKRKSILGATVEKYKTAVLQTNPELWQVFKNEFSTLLDSTYFEHFTNSNSSVEYHNKTRHSISLIANRAIAFCNQKTRPGCILQYEKFSVIIGQNSKHLKPGDKLEITAGVGSYSIAAQPRINIDNQAISVNDMGFAEYEKVVKGDEGKHKIPVMISYYTPDGINKTAKYEVEYFIDQ
jgi:hypothetical protein